MLEKMDLFFEARLAGYEEHMRTGIEGAQEFYPFTAQQLPDGHILDLGCGTGLELDAYFSVHPAGEVTGIDLSAGMLGALKEKFPEKALHLIQGSYFDVPLGQEVFDAAVSVESLHHFPREQKTALYRRLHRALKPGGYFILTDYFAPDEDYERFYFAELRRLKEAQGITDGDFYHYDTPLTVAHETQALTDAGFSRVEILKNWGATYTLKAEK